MDEREVGLNRENLKGRPIQAVAAILVDPAGDIYTVEETDNRPDYGKYAGMRTIPMEKINNGEAPEQAVLRLIDEEVGKGILTVFSTRELGYYGIGVAAVRCFVLRVIRKKPDHPPDLDGVTNPEWVKAGLLLETWTRQGVREMVKDYRADRRGMVRLDCRSVVLEREDGNL